MTPDHLTNAFSLYDTEIMYLKFPILKYTYSNTYKPSKNRLRHCQTRSIYVPQNP